MKTDSLDLSDSADAQQISDEVREHFHAALLEGDIARVDELLLQTPLLANADLRSVEARDEFTDGYPLVIACRLDDAAMAATLLEAGAVPDAPSTSESAPPEHGMPLHLATRQQNYPLANMLLDQGADPNSFPHCDHSTVEIAFFAARQQGISERMLRRSCSEWLPDIDVLRRDSASSLLVGAPSDSARLFARLIDEGGVMAMSAVLREGGHELLAEIVAHCADAPGSRHDHPSGTIFNGVLGAARWHGYPAMVRHLMSEYPERFDYPTLIETIHCAIVSHNRDGAYRDYREIIELQLERLASLAEIGSAQRDVTFNPIFTMAGHFTWHSNYGFRAPIAAPECYIDLAELFVSYGLGDVNYRDPNSDHSPLTAAVSRASHPGIKIFVRWLLDHGADRRVDAADEVNPLQIAINQDDDSLAAMLS